MVITDLFEHLIDDKNRLAIPSQVRSAMDPDMDGKAFFLVPVLDDRCMHLVPEKLFDSWAKVNPSGLVARPEVADATRFFFSMCTRLEPDKQGRVIIPDRFMADSKNPMLERYARLEHEVTLVGARDRIELWNRRKFLTHMEHLLGDRVRVQPTLERMLSAPETASKAAVPVQN